MRQNAYDDETFFTGYRAVRDAADNFNNLVEQPALRALLSGLRGRAVLGLGCGAGELEAYCVAEGAARVVATDISARMLALAREQNPLPQIEYVQSAMEDLDFPEVSFDVVVSSLALHYVADYAGMVRKLSGWLRAGGRFVFSIEHPIATAQKADHGWLRDEAGAERCWPVDDYADEGRREVTWQIPGGAGVVIYHRTLATILNTLTGNGLVVTDIAEPTASEATIRRLPGYASTRRMPPFLVVRAEKPRGK